MFIKRTMPLVPRALLLAKAHEAIVGASTRMDAGAGNVEKLLGEVQAELKRIGDDVKKTAENALKEAGTSGKLSAETKEQVDKLIMQATSLATAQGKLEEKLEKIETRNTDLEQRMATFKPGNGTEGTKSFGARVAEDEAFKAFGKNGAKGSVRTTLQVNQAITTITPGGGGLIWTQRDTEVVELPRREFTIRNLLNVVRTTAGAIEYAKMVTRTNNAAMVTETAQKPESDYAWDKADVVVRTIAHWVIASRQAMDDAPQLQGLIDGELRYGLALKEEEQLLNGDGAGENLDGLIPNATAYSAPFVLAGATLIDILRLAILQGQLAEYPPTGIVLHPIDWTRIETLKDNEARYLIGNPMRLTGPTLWGLPIVATQAMTVDKFLTGNFRLAATLYDRMDVEVLASSEDRDNFIKNMITVRAEERLALAVKRAAALIYGDFGLVT